MTRCHIARQIVSTACARGLSKMARKIEILDMAKARSDTLSLLVLAGHLLVGTVRNLLAVTVGNILGGTVLVVGVYWLAYLPPGVRTLPTQ